MTTSRAQPLLLLAIAVGLGLAITSGAGAGEAVPPGPPWQETWKDAKRTALRTGRPIFAYFTKRY